ncbi:TetR/AcrR family transcriptional regulator [Staphylococcus succinus]|uniref:TetR/AcrR family transcriptional regulator n=1 Tax=Staphylococcus succinus TaxID=61015 RepID=UPI000D1F428A|nr:TetR/AcrR family transcriptional regulator [Staphylococcus succinus]PTI45839.1 TetR/AcrR family transcriptional regulator [Staphylococcus succinus]
MSRPTGVNSADTKQFITDIATRLFEHKGYNATSMGDIKNETRYSKGTIYYHFKNKEELYLYCIKSVSQEFIKTWRTKSNESQSPKEQLYIWAELNYLMQEKPIMNTIHEYFVATDKSSHELVIDLYEPEFNIVQEILKKGVKHGEFKKNLSVYDTSVLLYNFIFSLENADLFGYRSREEQKNIYKYAIDLIIPGLK